MTTATRNAETLLLLRASQEYVNPNITEGARDAKALSARNAAMRAQFNELQQSKLTAQRIKDLAEAADVEELERLARWDPRAHRALLYVLLESKDEQRLRSRFERGDQLAHQYLLDLLVRQGRRDELKQLALGGDSSAHIALVRSLVEAGDVPAMQQLAVEGDAAAQLALSQFLAIAGRTDMLRECVHSAYRGAAEALIDLSILRIGGQARGVTWQLDDDASLSRWT